MNMTDAAENSGNWIINHVLCEYGLPKNMGGDMVKKECIWNCHTVSLILA